MATTTGGILEIVGVFGDLGMYKITSPGTTTVTVKLPEITLIKGAIVQVLDSGDRVATSDADVTWSGNSLTIADGGTFSLANTQTIYVVAWGDARR